LAGIGWTGERYLPLTDPRITGAQIHYEHLHRYYFAAQYVDKKSVLDLGCGEGYGSFILSKYAQRVVGVDSADETIEHAGRTYARSNLEFVKASILSVPIEEKQSFDVVACFEVLEHVAEHEDLLTEIKRLLKPDGLLIMSTPDKRSYSDEPNYTNPYHRKELYFDQFRELVRRYFANVDILGQRVYVGSHMWTLTRPDEIGGASDEFVIKKSGNVYSRAEYEAKKPLYFVALASDAQIGDGIRPRSYLTDADNTVFDAQLELTNELNLSRTKLAQHESTIQLLEAEKNKLTNELSMIRHSFGFRIMRFYGPHIDRLFPDGTSRGEFRKRIVASLRAQA
jgi:2-polyprenyl-3-methyl-5-hydroxy-6-metoxy-1,4-benzoquinol methylase